MLHFTLLSLYEHSVYRPVSGPTPLTRTMRLKIKNVCNNQHNLRLHTLITNIFQMYNKRIKEYIKFLLNLSITIRLKW